MGKRKHRTETIFSSVFMHMIIFSLFKLCKIEGKRLKIFLSHKGEINKKCLHGCFHLLPFSHCCTLPED